MNLILYFTSRYYKYILKILVQLLSDINMHVYRILPAIQRNKTITITKYNLRLKEIQGIIFDLN